jgi:hypothetical protein
MIQEFKQLKRSMAFEQNVPKLAVKRSYEIQWKIGARELRHALAVSAGGQLLGEFGNRTHLNSQRKLREKSGNRADQFWFRRLARTGAQPANIIFWNATESE